MAILTSISGEVQLGLRLLEKSFDPFQKDLEWFEYELRAGAIPSDEGAGGESGEPDLAAEALFPVQHAVRGRMNRKEFNDLLHRLDELAGPGAPLRFEPADLKFYIECSHETPLVYLIIAWFDLGSGPRNPERRYPMAHAGVRFLSDAESLRIFRVALEVEFTGSSRAARPSPPLRVN
jgi:hypothetical protein